MPPTRNHEGWTERSRRGHYRPYPQQLPRNRSWIRTMAFDTHRGINFLGTIFAYEADITRYIISCLDPRSAVDLLCTNSDINHTIGCQANNSDQPDTTRLRSARGWVSLPNLPCEEIKRGRASDPAIGTCGRTIGVLRCQGLQQPPFTPLPPDAHNPGRVCRACWRTTHIYRRQFEASFIDAAHVGVCPTCEGSQKTRFPQGRDACQCWDLFTEGRRICHHCRIEGSWQLNRICDANTERLKHTYLSYGVVTVDMERPAEDVVRCLCGKKHENHCQYGVTMCLICLKIDTQVVSNDLRASPVRRSRRVSNLRNNPRYV